MTSEDFVKYCQQAVRGERRQAAQAFLQSADVGLVEALLDLACWSEREVTEFEEEKSSMLFCLGAEGDSQVEGGMYELPLPDVPEGNRVGWVVQAERCAESPLFWMVSSGMLPLVRSVSQLPCLTAPEILALARGVVDLVQH